jgi:actin related protein 2/3 complex subunit 1A/1B
LLYVCSVDWHHGTNRIISSSHDRNIFVWINNEGKWQPQLVNVLSKQGILNVKWSREGDKFVACTAKKVIVGCFYENAKHWECYYIKEHKSAVTAACFDETGLFVISGGTDSKIIICSAYIDEVDSSKSIKDIPFEKVSIVCITYIEYIFWRINHGCPGSLG